MCPSRTDTLDGKTFSIVKVDIYYRVVCDQTQEFVTGKISHIKKAEKLLLENIKTEAFIEASKTMSKKQILEGIKYFNGRLRPAKTPWTIEEARLIASLYLNRGDMYKNSKTLYACAYQKGWLKDICGHMSPSRKKNKYIFGVLNPIIAIANIFDSETHLDFCKANPSAYNALRRYGVDTLELFENRDNIEYIKKFIKNLADEAAIRLME